MDFLPFAQALDFLAIAYLMSVIVSLIIAQVGLAAIAALEEDN